MRYHTGFMVIMLCLFLCALKVPGEEQKYTEEELYQKCKSSYSQNDTEAIIRYSDMFISRYTDSSNIAEVKFIRASALTDVGMSITAYKDIIEKYPKSKWAGRAHFQLAQIYYLQGKYKDASESYSRIMIYFTDDDEIYWKARYWHCKNLMSMGDFDSAIRSLESLSNVAMKDISTEAVLYSLGYCYYEKKDFVKVESILSKMLQTVPKSPWTASAYILLGKSLQSQGIVDEARSCYQKVITDYPDSIESEQAKMALDSLSGLTKQTDTSNVTVVKPQLEWQFIEKADDRASIKKDEPQPLTKPAQPPFEVRWMGYEEPKEFKGNQYFAVQVGAFGRLSTAQSLANKLKQKGYSVEVVNPSGKESPVLYKVRVGKYNSEVDARQAAKLIAEKEKLDTRVIQVSD